MSNYFTQAREVKQKQYGWYCNLCRTIGIPIVPYHSFETQDLEKAHELFKRGKVDAKAQ